MARSATSVAVLYSLFAALSTIINISSQIVSIWLYKGTFAVEISILAGTAAGLPLRYFLEKRYIFNFKSKNLSQDGETFVLYGAISVMTTLIFWVTEYSFHLVCGSDLMRYAGGIVGLAVGFYVKYQLDKKYVFTHSFILGQQ